MRFLKFVCISLIITFNLLSISSCSLLNIHKEDTESLDVVEFGRYDGQDIEWYVLEDVNDMRLLLSKYVLEVSKFSDTNSRISWYDSIVYEWLNNDFYDEAFSDTEKALITHNKIVCTGDYESQYYNIENIFILSCSELLYYSNSLSTSYIPLYQCYPTPSLLSRYQDFIDNSDDYKGMAIYWTRSEYYTFGDIQSASSLGWVLQGKTDAKFGVRPALWVKK